MNRDMQIAEAVRDACEAMHETEDVLASIGNSAYGEAYQDGWIEGTEAYRAAIQTANLQSILVNIPAPPAAEINRQLLDALRAALIVIEGALYCGHVLNANGVEKVQAIRTTIAAAEKEIGE